MTPMPSERDKANEAPDNLLVCQPLDVSRGRREGRTLSGIGCLVMVVAIVVGIVVWDWAVPCGGVAIYGLLLFAMGAHQVWANRD